MAEPESLVSRPPAIEAFFDEATYSVTYLVSDPVTGRAAIIDPVLDFEPKAAKLSTGSADAMLAAVTDQGLDLRYVLETHAHADHLSAADYIRRIDEMGGTLAAIENNFIRNEIHNAAYVYQQGIEKGERVVVGVNRFQESEPASPPVFRMDSTIEKKQIERVRELRASRAAQPVAEALDALEAAARGTDNLMPKILTACEAKATVGEISDRLRKVFGEYREG